MDDYVTKPVTLEALGRLLAQWRDRRLRRRSRNHRIARIGGAGAPVRGGNLTGRGEGR